MLIIRACHTLAVLRCVVWCVRLCQPCDAFWAVACFCCHLCSAHLLRHAVMPCCTLLCHALLCMLSNKACAVASGAAQQLDMAVNAAPNTSNLSAHLRRQGNCSSPIRRTDHSRPHVAVCLRQVFRDCDSSQVEGWVSTLEEQSQITPLWEVFFQLMCHPVPQVQLCHPVPLLLYP